jgi:hypothetical protein
LVAEKIAEIKEITPVEVAQHAFDNAYKFFRIPAEPVKPQTKSGSKRKTRERKTKK